MLPPSFVGSLSWLAHNLFSPSVTSTIGYLETLEVLHVIGKSLRTVGRHPSIGTGVAALLLASKAMSWNPLKSYCCGILATLA